MIEYCIRGIDPDKDFPAFDERILRLPEWRRRSTLSYLAPVDRLQSALAWEMLAALLHKHFGIGADSFRIEYDSCGKPSVSSRPDLHISLAHCPCGVMAAVADMPVGCDIEEIRHPYAEHGAIVARHYFTDAERRQIMTAADSALEFTKIWTVKEAVFKLDNSLDLETLDTFHLPPVRLTTTSTPGYAATLATLV